MSARWVSPGAHTKLALALHTPQAVGRRSLARAHAHQVLTVLINVFIWDKHATPTGLAFLFGSLVCAYFYKQAPLRAALPERVSEYKPLAQAGAGALSVHPAPFLAHLNPHGHGHGPALLGLQLSTSQAGTNPSRPYQANHQAPKAGRRRRGQGVSSSANETRTD